jgi:hypothetical protein
LWQGEAHFLRKEYGPAVEAYRKFRPDKNTRQNSAVLPSEWEEHLVRSLLRLRRFPEAHAELDRDRLKDFTVLRAAVCAVSGDVAGTEKELEEADEVGRQFYDDPDLGPALRSEPFREIRKKYPEPKKVDKQKKVDKDENDEKVDKDEKKIDREKKVDKEKSW